MSKLRNFLITANLSVFSQSSYGYNLLSFIVERYKITLTNINFDIKEIPPNIKRSHGQHGRLSYFT